MHNIGAAKPHIPKLHILLQVTLFYLVDFHVSQLFPLMENVKIYQLHMELVTDEMRALHVTVRWF
jgi:hypothetical protein